VAAPGSPDGYERCWEQPRERRGAAERALRGRQGGPQPGGILAALNRQHEFEVHLRGALRNGSTPAEVSETLIQVAVYAGVPAGVEAFRIAKRVLAEDDAAA
jgi:4-carboxymuconolactone decarboxylase